MAWMVAPSSELTRLPASPAALMPTSQAADALRESPGSRDPTSSASHSGAVGQVKHAPLPEQNCQQGDDKCAAECRQNPRP